MDLREALVICRRRNVPIEALGTFFGPKGKPVVRDLRADRVFPDFTFGTHLCDVEVDLDTGKVRVLRYVAAHDVGQAINPRSVEGQISGAVVQGLGMALLEEVSLDNGVNLTGGLFQYLIPASTDVPDIETVVLESGEGMGPFGARGIGEPPIGPPSAAVASAIHDAIGHRPTVLPITPERVLACVDASRAAGLTAHERRAGLRLRHRRRRDRRRGRRGPAQRGSPGHRRAAGVGADRPATSRGRCSSAGGRRCSRASTTWTTPAWSSRAATPTSGRPGRASSAAAHRTTR